MTVPEMFSACWMMASTFSNLQVKEVETLHLWELGTCTVHWRESLWKGWYRNLCSFCCLLCKIYFPEILQCGADLGMLQSQSQIGRKKQENNNNSKNRNNPKQKKQTTKKWVKFLRLFPFLERKKNYEEFQIRAVF